MEGELLFTVLLVAAAYGLVCVIALKRLLPIGEKIQDPNLRLIARSACFALVLTPTISVPATIPVPAVAQVLLGLVALHPALSLVGLIPILGVTVAIFLLSKVKGLFWNL